MFVRYLVMPTAEVGVSAVGQSALTADGVLVAARPVGALAVVPAVGALAVVPAVGAVAVVPAVGVVVLTVAGEAAAVRATTTPAAMIPRPAVAAAAVTKPDTTTA